jgi:hypothetical protein
MGVQIEEDMSVIRTMKIVTKLWVSVRKSDRDRDGCRVSLHTCLQELRKRLKENHGNCAEPLTKKAAADAASAATVSPDTPKAMFKHPLSVLQAHSRRFSTCAQLFAHRSGQNKTKRT